VRTKGLITAIEFQQPRELGAKLGWVFLHSLEKELFSQMIATTLLRRHRILTQVAAHGTDAIKILPPLIIGEKEVDQFVEASCAWLVFPLWHSRPNNAFSWQ
jgi:ornithine--oxo-acid transaminase